MEINIHIHRHDPEVEEYLMTISAEIQSLIDQIHANTAGEQAADTALKAQAAEISDLKNQIAALQASSGALSQEDVTALADAKQALATSVQTLQTDIPPAT